MAIQQGQLNFCEAQMRLADSFDDPTVMYVNGLAPQHQHQQKANT
jgi:hypothetical protein